MESPEEIENALGRLVPVAISERGRRALEGTIDGLSSVSLPVVAVAPQPRSGWWTAAVVIPTAAAAALTVALLMKGAPQKNAPAVVTLPKDTSAVVMDAGVSEPQQTINIDGDREDDMPAFNLIPTEGRAYVTLPNGMLTCFATANGNEFVVSAPNGSETFRGKLEDEAFPKVWKRHAKGIQAALKNSMDRQ